MIKLAHKRDYYCDFNNYLCWKLVLFSLLVNEFTLVLYSFPNWYIHEPLSAYNEQLGRSRVKSFYSKINFPLKMLKSLKFADFEAKSIPQKKRSFWKSKIIWKSTRVAVISLEHHHRNWDLSMVHPTIPTYDAFEGSWLTMVFLNFRMV